jgi:hypothetical protein
MRVAIDSNCIPASSRMHEVSRPLRLPTRCRLCKGAVIERTSSVAHSGFTWFHCLFCNHWWKVLTDETTANPDGELTGEVFIVTKGITYTLDSVAVSAIPEDVAKKHLETKTQERDIESQKVRRALDGLTTALEIVKAEEDALWKALQLDDANPQKSAAWRVAYNKTKDLAKEVKNLQAERARVTSGEYFFDELPTGISVAKTDGNGRFSLIIPCNGRYVVAARGPRETFRDVDPYWFVSTSLDGEPSKHLVLTNDNVLDAESENSPPE